MEAYSYDANGNRTASLNSDGVFSATYDDQDRMTTYGDFVLTYTDNGELTSKQDTVTGDLTEFVYDALGNLSSVTLPNGDAITYLVDGQGRRVGKEVNGVLVQAWLWRGQLQPVAELDGAGNVVARFVFAEGENVPELMVTSAGTYRLVKDHLGSVRQVVDIGTGTVAQEIAYDSWGRVLLDTNPGLQPFGFAGGLLDVHTDILRVGARDYDAPFGRWTVADPIRFGGGVNRYSYASADPLNQLDPEGTQARDPGTGKKPASCDQAALQECQGQPPGFAYHAPTSPARKLGRSDHCIGSHACEERPRIDQERSAIFCPRDSCRAARIAATSLLSARMTRVSRAMRRSSLGLRLSAERGRGPRLYRRTAGPTS